MLGRRTTTRTQHHKTRLHTTQKPRRQHYTHQALNTTHNQLLTHPTPQPSTTPHTYATHPSRHDTTQSSVPKSRAFTQMLQTQYHTTHPSAHPPSHRHVTSGSLLSMSHTLNSMPHAHSYTYIHTQQLIYRLTCAQINVYV